MADEFLGSLTRSPAGRPGERFEGFSTVSDSLSEFAVFEITVQDP